MISIVLVSHSRKLATGLIELMRQVTPPEVQIAEAAGVGQAYGETGTDAVHIAEVIQAVDSLDGVLVLMDLGSAILSAEMALELLPEEIRARVCICPAPFVEGALAAGVQAGLGSDLQAVCRESQKALEAKIAQVSAEAEGSAGNAIGPAGESATGLTGKGGEQVVPVSNRHGLHLRPAAQFVQTAATFKADVQVWNQSLGSGPASAKSINALAMLNVRQGDEMRIVASGPDAQAAVQALGDLVEQNFGEGAQEAAQEAARAAADSGEDAVLSPVENAGPGAHNGIPISGGIAIAPLFRLKREILVVEDEQAGDPEMEWRRLEQALARVKADLHRRQAELQQRIEEQRFIAHAPIPVGPEEAAPVPGAPGTGEMGAGAPVPGGVGFNIGILGAQGVLLEDPELIEPVRRRILQEGASAAVAWSAEIQEMKERFLGLSGSYLKPRAADIQDVGSQVLARLTGKTTAIEIPGTAPIILFADELSPTETAQLDLKRVAGLVTTSGASTSHSAILARALGIPAVSGIDQDFPNLPDGTPLILDGDQGLVWVDPPAKVRSRYAARKRAQAAGRKALQAASHEPARLKNGRQVEVLANVGSPAEAGQAAAQGADGVGLLRTEFLFLSRAQAPGEEEQLEALRAIGQAMDGRPVTVRTLDAGGDKDLPYLSAPGEANPFLGVRAIRLSLRHPDLFQTQLRAILRAAGEYPFRIMFPMIATLQDLELALEQLESAHAALAAEYVPHGWPVETGMMVEIPSAALLSEHFAPRVDFFSIGTNDLTQYTLAADRGNPALAAYGDALHPAVLSLIRQVAASAKRHGKRVGICGELAGDPLAAPVLVGLGLDSLSLNPAAVPGIKATIRILEEESTARFAESALQLDSAASVRAEAQHYLQAMGYGK